MGKKLTLEHCQALASERNGRCLSKKYVNNRKKYLWQCSKKHQWSALCKNVKRGQWCPECAGLKKKNINDCRKLAKINGGKCLSNSYANNKTKMLWECTRKHQWESIYNSIQLGHWCPVCGYLESAKKSNNSTILRHWKSNEELVCIASYEASVVNFLNKNKIDFKWQIPFTMPDKRMYIIDCFLMNDDIYVEIKGYFRKDAYEKWSWFHKEYPNSELWDKRKLIEMEILQ